MTSTEAREPLLLRQLMTREIHGRLRSVTRVTPRAAWQLYWGKLPTRFVYSLPSLLQSGSSRELQRSCLLGFSKDLYHLLSYRSKGNCKRYYFELWYWSTSTWHSFRKELEIPIGPPDLESEGDELLFEAHQEHPYMQVFESDNSKLFAISTEPLRLSAEDTSTTRHLTLFPSPVQYAPVEAVHLSYDCLSEVSFKPHLHLISVDAHRFHLVLNNGTALYHIVIELCVLDPDHAVRGQEHSRSTQPNPFDFAPSDALTTSLTLLHDTRDCWHALAEDEVKLVYEPITHRTRRPPARLLIRSMMKFDAEQYLSGLVKRMSVLKTESTEDWHLATALVTSDATFAALSVKTNKHVHNLLLRLSFTSKSTALWHLSSVTIPAQRLSRWVHRSLLPFIHSKAQGEFSPAHAVLPLKSSWCYPLVLSNLPVLQGKSLACLPHCYFPIAIAK
jgi:hypothetical protein